jgi:ERCC4-type nuclease
MCSKFAYPYLLIESPESGQFRKEEFMSSYIRATGEKVQYNIRKQLIELMVKYPKINIIWSSCYLQSVKYFIELKKNRENPEKIGRAHV